VVVTQGRFAFHRRHSLTTYLPRHICPFIGSIIVRADNKELQSVSDLKNKVIAAQSISDFSAAQVQFFTMLKKGLNYIMDPVSEAAGFFCVHLKC
jgi:hypothetical protein